MNSASKYAGWRIGLNVKGAKFLSLFCAMEVWLLLFILLLLWLIVTFCCRNDSHPWLLAFGLLFDVSKTTGADVNWALPFKMLSYLVVWLLGGGVLISALVKQYDRIADCEYRLFASVLDKLDHVVVFGWNSSVLSFIRHEQESRGSCLYVILTTSDAKLIKAELDDVGNVHYLIYRCAYDDTSERSDHLRLKSRSLRAVYIAGEGQLALHDTRAVLLADLLTKSDSLSKNTKLYCDIYDFGLANERIKMGSDCGLSIQYRNFHLLWGGCVCKNLNHPVYVVGFGAMGKAVALAALRKDSRAKVFFSGADVDKLDYEERRFLEQFPEEGSRIHRLQWDVFRVMLADAEPKAVVVAMHQPEKAMLCLMDVVRWAGANSVNNQYYLSLEIDGAATGEAGMLPTMNVRGIDVTLFGMKRGAPWNTEIPLLGN